MTIDSEFKGFIAKQINKKFYRCFWPFEECKKEAIRAHSIQNSRVLQAIEQNGHVVMLQPKINFDEGPKAEFKDVGRNKATTFTGLCGEHDNQLFKPIDDSEIK
ncbi:MAG: hypothetical protein L6Q53_04755 [Candidatus Brocadia sinica]|nr:hypothetical protein [Candidatus Brocadia sinica]NUO06571.1 hypothetical protein [Candidatus Brocadia sinica]